LTADSGTEFFYVDEIASGVATYTDSETNSAVSLNEILPTTGWDEPEDDLAGIVLHPGNFAVAFAGNTVYISEVNQLHAYPSAYAFSYPYDIVGVGVVGYSIIVLTKGTPGLIVGQIPTSLAREKIYSTQSCLAQASVVQTKDFVGFSSPDGYFGIRADGSEVNLTEQLATRTAWQSIGPSAIKAAWHDNQIFLFTSRTVPAVPGVWILRLESSGNDLTFSEQTADSLHVDLETDALYFSLDSLLYQWEGGSTNRTAKWQSKTEVFDRPQSISVVQVLADSYPVTFRLYASGSLVYTGTATSDEAFHIPVLRREREWSIEVEGATTIHPPLLAAGSIQQLQAE
jgi:hypothetical protein